MHMHKRTRKCNRKPCHLFINLEVHNTHTHTQNYIFTNVLSLYTELTPTPSALQWRKSGKFSAGSNTSQSMQIVTFTMSPH